MSKAITEAMELKPCPFCGGSASIERYGDRRQSTIYQCDNCSCSLETGEEWSHRQDWNRRAISASPPAVPGEVEPHSDDLAVDRFAAAMKAKLAEKRAQGYHGWDDPEDCTIEHLSNLLVKHVGKGDPVDVGNFAMMIHQRGERIK